MKLQSTEHMLQRGLLEHQRKCLCEHFISVYNKVCTSVKSVDKLQMTSLFDVAMMTV